jgi:hypothetical protein
MPVRLYHIAVDAHDPRSQAAFWAAALGQEVLFADEEEAIVGADPHAYPGLCFLRVPEGKTLKNRLHLDLDPDDRDSEVARLVGLGARKVDVGQGSEVTWVVMADPEGNEFCVLQPHRSLVD